MWKFIKEYFTFTRSEIRVILILSALLLIILGFRLSLRFLSPPINKVSNEELRLVAEFIAAMEYKDQENKKMAEPKVEALYDHLKEFDPNLVSVMDLKLMGFPDNVISNISKYRKSGGHFYKKADFRKIYGLSDSAFNKIVPFILINDTGNKYRTDLTPVNNFAKEVKPINLNIADSAELVKLKGIGPGFAIRIIKYRKKLGGYIVPEQLLEVFGMDSTRFNLFKDVVYVDTSGLRKIDLNKIKFSELARHPYMDEQTAASIIKFRDFKGRIKDIDELNSYNLIQTDKLKKIEPYLYISH